MRAALMLMYRWLFTTKVLYIAGLDQPVTGALLKSHVGLVSREKCSKGRSLFSVSEGDQRTSLH